MACNELGQKVTDYHFGELEESQRREVETHLRECADCRAELELLEKTTALVSQACISQAADLPSLSLDRRDELRSAARKRQQAMDKAQNKPKRGWFGRLFSIRNTAWAFSLSCACIVMIAAFTATGGKVHNLLGQVSSTLTEDGVPVDRSTAIEMTNTKSGAYKTDQVSQTQLLNKKKPTRRPTKRPAGNTGKTPIYLARPKTSAPKAPPPPVPASYGGRRSTNYGGRRSRGPSVLNGLLAGGAGGASRGIAHREAERNSGLARLQKVKRQEEKVVVKRLLPRSYEVTETSAAAPRKPAPKPAKYSFSGKGTVVGDALSSTEVSHARPKAPADLGGSFGDDSFSFDTVDTPAKSGDIDSRRRMFEKLGGKGEGGEFDEGRALTGLSKSYVDKLTRMTPSERQKLKHSLKNYLIIDAEKVITKETEKKLEKDGKSVGLADNLKFISYGINSFVETNKDKFSTFAMDCDTAAYTLGRTYLQRSQLPPWQSVRVEEYVNFFDYEYDTPEEAAFAIHGEAAPSPYRKNHLLLRVGIKAREVSKEQRRPARLTFVIDVSGSMSSRKRLPLVRKALKMLVDELREGDEVCIVVYGSRAKLFLDWTEATRKQSIKNKIMRLRTQGSTNAEEGLVLGYQMAARHFSNGCDNRVILCSDGVANVGKRGPEAILKEIKKYADKGIYLTTVGFGRGNYSDVMMERLANKGNGTYNYVDDEKEARRIFVEKLTGTLVTVGKDAKIQVEFSPEAVKSYRLLGYENRDVKDEDFRNDKVDAGEVGAGHSVTALYELELNDELGSSLGTVRVRYQSPRSSRVTEIQELLDNKCIKGNFKDASASYRLAALVGQFAEILRKSPYAKKRTIEELIPHIDDVAKELAHDEHVQELKKLIDKVADK